MTSEFLIHAADVEGLCQGIDEDLVQSKVDESCLKCRLCSCDLTELGEWTTIPTTYAGGAKGKECFGFDYDHFLNLST
jgi:phosphoribosylformimino-5-aminoimidazole carboxamide ribotide isomerase